MSETDWELLQRYCRNQAEEAFTELVRRHVNLVYSAALRQNARQLVAHLSRAGLIRIETGEDFYLKSALRQLACSPLS